MKIKFIPLTVGLILLFTGGCGSKPVPTPPPAASKTTNTPQWQAAHEEIYGTLDAEVDEEERVKVFIAAENYIRHASKRKPLGLSLLTLSENDNAYLVAVDTGPNQETTNLIVRKFVASDGKSYWKADGLTPELRQILSGAVYQKITNTKDKGGDSSDRDDTPQPDDSSNDN